MIDDEFVAKNPKKACSFKSLGQLRYLSALKHVDIVLGNSSSGLTEAPSFKIATIDIGDRQKGRIKAESVISCDPAKISISNAIQEAFSEEFQEKLKKVKNPYGDGGASEKIVKILKEFDYSDILKKKFYDINYTFNHENIFHRYCILFPESFKKNNRFDAEIIGVATKSKSHFNADHADLAPICEITMIPYKYVRDINAPHILEWIKSLNPDVIFCFGWSSLIKIDLLYITDMGVVGFHPTELPYNRGRHPLIWTLVLGLEKSALLFSS